MWWKVPGENQNKYCWPCFSVIVALCYFSYGGWQEGQTYKMCFSEYIPIWEQSYIENSFRSFLQTMVPHSKIQLILNGWRWTSIPCLLLRSHGFLAEGTSGKNHEFIRYIIPKGTTFAGLDQEQVTLITNHINSVARASLNGCTPFELALLLIDRKLLDLCQLERIPANQVILKPSLLKSNCKIHFRCWFHNQAGGS